MYFKIIFTIVDCKRITINTNLDFSLSTETPPPPYSRYAMEDLKPKGKKLLCLY